jgi:hypothetical protein
MHRSAFAGLVVVGLAACSVFGGDDPAAAPPPAGAADGGTDGEGGLPPVGGSVDKALAIEVVPGALLIQGTTTTVTVKVTRGEGTPDPAKITVSGGPRDGITATSVDVPVGTMTAEISITVPALAGQGALHLTLTASTPLRTVMAPYEAFVRGKPGSLDTTFGTGGLARHLFGAGKNAKATDLVVLPDDRLIAVANCNNACVVRTSPDGSLDMAYGTGGSAAEDVTFVGQAGVDSTGALFLGGNGGAGSIKIGKLTPAGKPDLTFGISGGVAQFGLLNGPPEMTPPSLTVRKDGVIVVGFPRTHGNGTQTVGVAARTSTGAQLPGFGTAGVTEGAVGGQPALGTRANGNIWTAFLDANGCHVNQQDGTTGANDPAFGGGGLAPVTGTNSSWALGAAATLPDGSLVPAFHTGTKVLVPKFAPNGSSIDLAWGVSGVATIDDDAIPSLSVDAAGQVLVTLLRTGGLRFTRLALNGSRDVTFGDNGTVVHSFGMNHVIARALVQKDGRIVVLGTEDFSGGSDVSLTRYWN